MEKHKKNITNNIESEDVFQARDNGKVIDDNIMPENERATDDGRKVIDEDQNGNKVQDEFKNQLPLILLAIIFFLWGCVSTIAWYNNRTSENETTGNIENLPMDSIDKEIINLKESVQQRDETIHQLQTDISRYKSIKNDIDKLTSINTQQEKQFQNIRFRDSTKIQDLNNQIQQQERQIKQLQNSLSQRGIEGSTEVEDLKKQVKQKDAQIDELKRENKSIIENFTKSKDGK